MGFWRDIFNAPEPERVICYGRTEGGVWFGTGSIEQIAAHAAAATRAEREANLRRGLSYLTPSGMPR